MLNVPRGLGPSCPPPAPPGGRPWAPLPALHTTPYLPAPCRRCGGWLPRRPRPQRLPQCPFVGSRRRRRRPPTAAGSGAAQPGAGRSRRPTLMQPSCGRCTSTCPSGVCAGRARGWGGLGCHRGGGRGAFATTRCHRVLPCLPASRRLPPSPHGVPLPLSQPALPAPAWRSFRNSRWSEEEQQKLRDGVVQLVQVGCTAGPTCWLRCLAVCPSAATPEPHRAAVPRCRHLLPPACHPSQPLLLPSCTPGNFHCLPLSAGAAAAGPDAGDAAAAGERRQREPGGETHRQGRCCHARGPCCPGPWQPLLSLAGCSCMAA